jgi:putative SOS response-associated peptidase YedK
LNAEAADDSELLKPYPVDDMRVYPVSTRVNRPVNDDAALIEEVEPPETTDVTPKGIDED